jgi:hypothetical protein
MPHKQCKIGHPFKLSKKRALIQIFDEGGSNWLFISNFIYLYWLNSRRSDDEFQSNSGVRGDFFHSPAFFVIHFADVCVPAFHFAKDPAGALLIAGRNAADPVFGVEIDRRFAAAAFFPHVQMLASV